MLNAIESGVFTASTRDRLLELERRKAELEATGPDHALPLQCSRDLPA